MQDLVCRGMQPLGSLYPGHDLARVETAQGRALHAIYSGPYKLTPAYRSDPVHSFPFEGRGIMTQKMDGMFMLWDGHGQMYNRGRGGHGNSHSQHPPRHFTKHLPPVELEGELCFRSGEYSRGHSAKNNHWKDACLFVFDAPRHPGTYAQRLEYVNELLRDYDPRYVRPVPFLGIATTRRVLDATLARVRATVPPKQYGRQGGTGAPYQGGEGVMVLDPDARYRHSCFEPKHHGHKKGQTPSMYKWLEEYGNDECVVVSMTPDSASATDRQHANSLRVSLPNGAQFMLSSISCLGVRATEVRAGSIITFTYKGWSATGLPIGASAQAFRTDRTWQDIVDNFIPPPQLSSGLVVGRVRRTMSLQGGQGLAASSG